MQRIMILFLALICIAVLSIFYSFWPHFSGHTPEPISGHTSELTSLPEQERQDLHKTKELLNRGQAEEAFVLIHQYANTIDSQTEIGREWLDLLIRASEATLNKEQLKTIYAYYPKSFEGHEKASLLIAYDYLAEEKVKDYQRLRDTWKGRETRPEDWFILDVDRLLVDRQPKEAIDLLNSQIFQGKNDTPRLIRLAFLSSSEHPKEAWDYLAQAFAKDPENPEIRSYRAKLLEASGKPVLALSEYMAALQAEPHNIYLKDQLADFYIRNKQYVQALQLWSENLTPPTLDFVWLKALFWNRMISPLSFDWQSTPIPYGKLEPFIAYLVDLKPGEFWNDQAYAHIQQSSDYLKTQQATFWLRLLENLKNGKESEALELLTYNPFEMVSWNPQLQEALKRILTFRQTGQLAAVGHSQSLTPSLNSPLPPFYQQLAEWTDREAFMPGDLKSLLTGSEVFSAALFASGWAEAGLQLSHLAKIPVTYPEWVAVDFTQALRVTKGPKAALEFATKQAAHPALTLLMGELYLASSRYEEALAQLNQIVKEDSEIGARAAWLISLIYIDRHKYPEAIAMVQSQPRLSADTLGQETLARIALLQGDILQAEKLYVALEPYSSEARSYLARKAYSEKDWTRARDLTERLLKQYPTNTLLQENLKKIIEEQAKTDPLRQ
jgi:thioredoxin-like negative regulator of GroEL